MVLQERGPDAIERQPERQPERKVEQRRVLQPELQLERPRAKAQAPKAEVVLTWVALQEAEPSQVPPLAEEPWAVLQPLVEEPSVVPSVVVPLAVEPWAVPSLAEPPVPAP